MDIIYIIYIYIYYRCIIDIYRYYIYIYIYYIYVLKYTCWIKYSLKKRKTHKMNKLRELASV